MRYLYRSCFLVAVLLALNGCSRSADQSKKSADQSKKGKEEHAKKSPAPLFTKKVTVHVHHEEKKFDLKDEAKRKEFLRYVNDGEVDEIEIGKDPMSLSADLGLWAIVVFVGLVFILKKYAWGPMLEGLTKRETTIRLSVEEAQLAREETERLRAQFKSEMDQAFAKIPQLMEDARRKADKLVEEMRGKASADIQADRDRLRREIELARDQALQQIWEKGAQLATVISAKVLARTLTAEDHQRLFNIAMEEMKSNAGNRN